MAKFIESKNVELKRAFSLNMYKTISAFSNLNGGSVYIGIDDDGKIVGVENIKKIKLDIENTINDVFVPRVTVEFITHKMDNKDVLELKVKKGNKRPHFYKNIAYTRTDTSTVPMDHNTLTRLMLSSENIGFDEVETNRSDLTFDYLEKVLKESLGLKELNKSSLTTLGLMKNGICNNSAVLLSDNGNMKNSYVDLAKFKISNDVFEDRIMLDNASCLSYYFELLEIFNKYYPTLSLVSVPKRIEREQIPFGAFKEAILNAIIHRDYLINRGVQISMYEYGIEINSPGGLPEGINETVYLSGGTSILRNKTLASVFFRLGIIEQFGTGIKRIISNYSDTDEKPSFVIEDYQLKIILPVIGYEYHKLNEEEGILAYLRSHPNATRAEMEKKLHIEKNSLLRKLNGFIEKGLIKKRGSGPNINYYL